ncbi:hypothetical protein AVEN_119610-1 [Araneus ventricosus]|uniref:Uncharacterized protein n=1 Tax=Araneus ventricosus TaxID=182803 RepID=A0A4Y2SGB8_ARAVE|nr:hypothetical protein AVEN_119610-1 [Araneus ventricosus]
MFKTIDRPANCEIRAVIKFLNARNVRPCEIYRQISEGQSGPSSIRLPFVFSSQEIKPASNLQVMMRSRICLFVCEFTGGKSKKNILLTAYREIFLPDFVKMLKFNSDFVKMLKFNSEFVSEMTSLHWLPATMQKKPPVSEDRKNI